MRRTLLDDDCKSESVSESETESENESESEIENESERGVSERMRESKNIIMQAFNWFN